MTRYHAMGQPQICVDGDVARYTGTNVVFRSYADRAEPGLYMYGGHYDNTFIHTPEGWRIHTVRWRQRWEGGDRTPDGSLRFARDVLSTERPSFGQVAPSAVPPGTALVRLFRDLDMHYSGALSSGSDSPGGIWGLIVLGERRTQALRSDPSMWVQHVLTNVVEESLDMNTRVWAYLFRTVGDASGLRELSGSRIRAHLERCPEEWRIVDLEMEDTWVGSGGCSTVVTPRCQPSGLVGTSNRIQSVDLPPDQLLAAYAWANDTRDRVTMTKLFHPEVESDIAFGPGRVSGRDALIYSLLDKAEPHMVQHYVANMETERCESGYSVLGRVHTVGADTTSSEPALRGGEYRLHVSELDGRWVIDRIAYKRSWLARSCAFERT